VNRSTSTASCETFIGQISSPISPHHGSGEEMAEHLLLSCPKRAAELSIISVTALTSKTLFQDYVNLVELLITSGHLPPHTETA